MRPTREYLNAIIAIPGVGLYSHFAALARDARKDMPMSNWSVPAGDNWDKIQLIFWPVAGTIASTLLCMLILKLLKIKIIIGFAMLVWFGIAMTWFLIELLWH